MSVATFVDLPLELVEKIVHHLDVKDVLELMMVNKRLYSSYAMDQSIVFGKNVAGVFLGQNSNSIKKFVDSPSFQLDATLLPFAFARRIDSCDKLLYHRYFNAERPDGMLLDQLKSVNQLRFDVYTKEDCQKFFTNFCGSVKKNATLHISRSFEQGQSMKEQLVKFIENQLNGCEKITLNCYLNDWFHVYHEAMMKTQIKMVSVQTDPTRFDKIVKRIVNQGIPSKNSEAAILIDTHLGDSWDPRDSEVGDLLSQAQGLQRVDDDESHSALVSCANELIIDNSKVFPLLSFLFDENSSCFRHRIDPTTSCIYVFESDSLGFCAFYMPCQ